MIGFLYSLYGCRNKYTHDIADIDLPAYTVSGKNTAGAYIDKLPWVASGDLDNWKFMGTYPNLDGLLIIESYSDSNYTDLYFENGLKYTSRGSRSVTLKFHLKSLLIDTLPALAKIADTTIQLGNSTAWAKVFNNNNPNYDNRGGSGDLRIRNCKITPDSVIISGTFGFATSPDQSVYHTVFNGRFDYTVKDVQLFKYR